MAYTNSLDFGPYGNFGTIQTETTAPPAASTGSGTQIGTAGIGAAASLGAALFGASSQNKATKAQAQSTAAALEFQKQQEADRKAEYAKSLAKWEATRKMLFQHLGLDIGAAEPALAGGMVTAPNGPTPSDVPSPTPSATAPTPMASTSPGFISALRSLRGSTLGDLMNRGA